MRKLLLEKDSQISFSESNIMHLMRFFAILSVIFAHSADILDNSKLWDYAYFQITTAFGIFGVPVFFFSSGYYFFNNQRRQYGNFLHHKIKTFFIPWLFLTSIVYLSIALRKDGLNFKDYLYFIIGIQNYTYFLTILLLFFLVFLRLKFSRNLIIVSLLISIVSLWLTTSQILNVNQYLNPFNWLIYFMIGIVFNKYKLLQNCAMFAKKWVFAFILLFIISNIIFVVYRLKINYWQIGGYIYIVITFFLFLGIATKYQEILGKFIFIGKESMSIYLMHSLFVGGLVYVTNRYELWYLFPLRPFIVLAMVLFVLFIYQQLSKYWSIEKYSFPLIGLNIKK